MCKMADGADGAPLLVPAAGLRRRSFVLRAPLHPLLVVSFENANAGAHCVYRGVRSSAASLASMSP